MSPASEPIPRTFRSGYVALLGPPNVGKSTLLNRLVGHPLAAVSKKPQTTRERVVGIVTGASMQIVFLDTPGLLTPRFDLHRSMIRSIKRALADADLALVVHDATRGISDVEPVLGEVRGRGTALLVAVNKIDRVKKAALLPVLEALHEASGGADVVPISALDGENVDRLLDLVRERIPPGPKLYPDDPITEQPERFFVAEIIREKALEQFGEEVPHAIAVEIERFVEEEGRRDEIDAAIAVERPSQKRILVGQNGRAIKALGIASREAIETFLGRPVILRLFVRVVADWRRDPRALRRLGYE